MDIVWTAVTIAGVVLLLAGGAAEVYGLRTRRAGDTYSEWMRPLAKRYRGVFLALCGLLAFVGGWLPGHILG